MSVVIYAIGSLLLPVTAQDIESAGTPIRSAGHLHLAIEGEGFFVLRNPESGEEFATRRGDFGLDARGRIINLQGFRLQGFNEPIGPHQAYYDDDEIGDVVIDRKFAPGFSSSRAGTTNVAIHRSGQVIITLQDGTQFVRGQILLQQFERPQALSSHWPQNYSGFDAARGLVQPVQPGCSGLGLIIAGALDSSLFPPGIEENSVLIVFDWFYQEARIIATGAGQSSQLEASTDFSNWTPVYTNQSPSNLVFGTPASEGESSRFFRVMSSEATIPDAEVTPSDTEAINSALQDAIRSALEDFEGEITVEDLKRVTTLDLRGNRLGSLALPEGLTNLTTLYLGGTSQATDFSVLRKLPNLTTLHLSAYRLTDFSFLSELPHLTTLSLSGEGRTILRLPEGLSNLTHLVLDFDSLRVLEVPEGFDLRRLEVGGFPKSRIKFYKSVGIEVLTGNIQISWSDGILQSSDALGGAWKDVDGAKSPYQLKPAEPQKFFRVKSE